MILVVITEGNFQSCFFQVVAPQKQWSSCEASPSNCVAAVCMMELVGGKSRWVQTSCEGGLHRQGSFLKTPLPFCTSWCYHNPGPRVDLLWLMASSSASTRVHRIICWEGQTLHPVESGGWGGAAMSGTGKGSGRHRDEVREWKEQSTISLRRLSSLICKQRFSEVQGDKKKKRACFSSLQTEWPCGRQVDQSFTANHESSPWSPAVVSSTMGWVVEKKHLAMEVVHVCACKCLANSRP